MAKNRDQGTARAQVWREVRYQSVRKPKLRAPALVVPPPVPDIAAPQETLHDCPPTSREPEPEEVGLRVLAALESMQSLEPDFCDDLAAEASVTIIERADVDSRKPEQHRDEVRGSLRARIDDMGVAPRIAAEEYAAYQGPIEEATVEIIERPAGGQNAAATSEPVDLAERRPALKAAAGGRR